MSDIMSDDAEATPFLPIFTKSSGTLLEFYLSGEIAAPDAYTNWFHVMRNASSRDTIVLHINSVGGNASTAIQFLRVLSETDATVVASVEGDCMSAATMIFLSADTVEISPHSIFLFHNYSGGAVGKGGEVFEKVKHLQRWSEDLLRSVYSGFLTKEEIEDILAGKDIWMTAAEVHGRVQKKAKRPKK